VILTDGGFKILRDKLFGGSLSQSQVDALNFLVKSCYEANMSYPETAYSLATVYHECALVVKGLGLFRTMKPVKEAGSDAYLRSKKYYPYIGYGYVQLTWKENYAKVGKLIGVDLIAYPEKALEPEIAAKIMTGGMLNGWFTGVGFRRKRPVGKYDRSAYIRARAIINGADKAELIADYAMVFEKALRAA
jgi:hypothetical protein